MAVTTTSEPPALMTMALQGVEMDPRGFCGPISMFHVSDCGGCLLKLAGGDSYGNHNHNQSIGGAQGVVCEVGVCHVCWSRIMALSLQ